jgi:hypothetical protein
MANRPFLYGPRCLRVVFLLFAILVCCAHDWHANVVFGTWFRVICWFLANHVAAFASLRFCLSLFFCALSICGHCYLKFHCFNFDKIW